MASSDERELIKNVRDFGPIYKVAIQNLLSGSCLNTAREPSPSTSGIDRVGDPYNSQHAASATTDAAIMAKLKATANPRALTA